MQLNKRAGLFRRFAASVYDGVIIVALWIMATFLLLPFTHGKAIPAGTRWFQVYCFGIFIFYFCGSWRYAQQTIGMKAWRYKVVDLNGEKPSWRAVVMRFFFGSKISKTQLQQCD